MQFAVQSRAKNLFLVHWLNKALHSKYLYIRFCLYFGVSIFLSHSFGCDFVVMSITVVERNCRLGSVYVMFDYANFSSSNEILTSFSKNTSKQKNSNSISELKGSAFVEI